jgi:hypothetical protein
MRTYVTQEPLAQALTVVLWRQVVEAHTATILALGVERLALVGDPQQLPAIVRSPWCKKGGFSRSLMERLVEVGRPKLYTLSGGWVWVGDGTRIHAYLCVSVHVE